jgi:LacI family transcriptional regulator
MPAPDDKKTGKRVRVTIIDVASKAGVHVSTASRALSQRKDHRISASVVRKIERVAEQLGYRPNLLASGLRTQRTGSIGLVVPNLGDPLFAPIIASVQERAAQNGYVTYVASSDYKPDKLLSIIEIMSRQSVAGLVVASFDLQDPAADRCLELDIPTVAVLRDPCHPGLSSITMDDESGVREVVEHILELGHRNIVYITAPLAASTARNRLAGFTAVAEREAAAGSRFDVIEADAYDLEEGERVMGRLIGSGLRWTAVICFNDLLAVGALVALKSAGIACPDQVSVTGVNNLPFVSLLSPSLTTLHNAGREIGLQGADLLMALIENGDDPIRRVLLPSRLVRRDSTGPAPPTLAAGGTGRSDQGQRAVKRHQTRPSAREGVSGQRV